MPQRVTSKGSEYDLDISANLIPNDAGFGHQPNGKLDGDFAKGGPGDDLDIAAITGTSEDESDDEEHIIAASQLAANRKTMNPQGKNIKKGGAFQSLGLNAQLLNAITKKGFSVPTPIQRKTIPLILDNQDVVGMARTGSGKTAAFVIPMIEKLKSHSAKVGARAIVMSPSRELALQTLRVVKDFGRGTDLRAVLLVGGDSLEEQFGQMTSNPDIIIATPGRFMHLLVEMSLDISSVRYVVFDEADRLFEMGFAIQLNELLHALPSSRQTLLFSATLPKSLVEFAKAGLRDPRLVRLDAESKISSDLQSAFLTVKKTDKEGALLHILQDIICMPLKDQVAANARSHDDNGNPRKRKRSKAAGGTSSTPSQHSTIVFAATKHHVEYLTTMLSALGYAVSYVYGSLDQVARKLQVENFRAGVSTILVVTDVAARGIDMPMLANVINYDFASQPKIFIHRVGRTARAGQKGWSYSLVQDADLPYLLDLQLLLAKSLVVGRANARANFAADMVLGSTPRRKLEPCCETINLLLARDEDLANLRVVAMKGEKLYTRTRNSASNESAKRAKKLAAEGGLQQASLLYQDDPDADATEKENMLARISGFRPQETIFEIGRRGKDRGDVSETMRKHKEKLAPRRRDRDDDTLDTLDPKGLRISATSQDMDTDMQDQLIEDYSDDGFEVTFPRPDANDMDEEVGWQDKDHFMAYEPKSIDFTENRGYGVHSGSYNSAKDSSFAAAATGAVLDITNDESKGFGEASKTRQTMRWDKKSKKYVALANDVDGSKGARMMKSESGQKIAASFRSGRFEAWKRSNKIGSLPKTGEVEQASTQQSYGSNPRNSRFKHYASRAPKAPDKYRDDYYKKKKRIEEQKAEKGEGAQGVTRRKPELRGVDDVRKQRQLKDRRREKNARPSRNRKR